MLQLQQLRTQPSYVIERLLVKQVVNAEVIVHQVLAQDESRRSLITQLEHTRQEMNRIAKAVGLAMSQGKTNEAETLKQKTKNLKEAIASQEDELAKLENELQELLVTLPNLPHESVPQGNSAAANQLISTHEQPLNLPPTKLPHWELAAKHRLIDFELGSKVTGAGFPVYLGKGARLQRALIAFFLDQAVAQGYLEVQPPILVNRDSGFGTGQIPDKEGQMYFITADELYLIPTAEVPITNLFRDALVDASELPLKRVGYTPCFRREAGSYGKDVRGLNRLHQFDKVEIVQITRPENSYATLEQMKDYVAGLLALLELPYRILLLCGGDMTFSSAKTYDLEVFSAGQERWLEVSSVSNFEAYQANRLKLRYRTQDKKTQLAHTLNGSALALPRIVAALLENNQQADGSILLPGVLHSYTGFATIG